MHRSLTPRNRRERNAVYARCQSMLEQLVLPQKFSIAGFCRAVEVVTARPIVLHPRDPGWGPPGLCGVLASTPSADHVIYTADGSRIGQATTIVHECGHILFDGNAGPQLAPGDGAYLEVLGAAGISTKNVTRVRGRTNFSELEERVVETFASLVLRSGLAGDLDRANAPGARLTDRFG